MSGSRLGRGRAGRLALFVCAILAVSFIVFLYRSTSAEMARLRDLHVKCAQQQEALAAQLQVIYEYKVQLEKTLSNEKSANAAAKEELQQKATHERSLRDRDTVEATQRYNALQQSYNILKVELQDLKDEGKKKEDVARKNIGQLEKTLQELRAKQKKDVEAFEHLKNEHVQVLAEKEQIEEKYENLKKATGEDNGNVERLQKQVIQLRHELDEAKKTPHFSVGGVGGAKVESSQVLPRHENDANDANFNDNDVNNNENNNNSADNNNHIEKPSNADGNSKDNNNPAQVVRPSSQHQVSRPSDEMQVGQNPQPLQAPQNHRHLDDEPAENNAEEARFESRNGNIVPVGPNEQNARPIPYERQAERQEQQQQQQQQQQQELKQVLAPPDEPSKLDDKKALL